MRILKIVLSIMLVMVGFGNLTVFADESQGYTYEVKDGEAVITAYSGSDSHLYIPVELDGYPVREIREEAIDCSYITYIEIPSGVRKVAPKGFYNCQTVVSLSIPDSLDASNGFEKLVNLEKAVLTRGNGEVFNYATASSVPWNASGRNINEVLIDDRIEVIGDYVFEGFQNMETVALPQNLKEVGVRSFYNWLSLSELQLPLTVETVRSEAFGCDPIVRSNRATIVLPGSIKTIEEDAFDFNNIYYTYKDSAADQYLKKQHIIHKIINLDIGDDFGIMDIGTSGMFEPARVPEFMKESVRMVSSDDSILEVKEDGYYLAHRKGSVDVTVMTESGQLTKNFTVRNIETVDTYYLKVPVNSYYQLNAKDDFERVNDSNLEDVVYQCEDENVTVTDSGLILINEPGSYRISVLLNKTTIGTYLIDGIKAVESIIPEMESFAMTLDNSLKFTADVYPEDARDATLYYYSEDPEIVSTNLTGSLYAHKKGETYINIFSRDNNAVARVRVRVLDDSMSVPVSAFPMMVGKSFDLNIEGNDLSYYSSDEAVATVSETGIVYANGTGSCYITVSNEDAARTIDVAVYDAFSYGVDLSEWNDYISVDSFVQMKRSGIDFVLLRAGYSDYYEDYMFENNYYNARQADLEIGAYHYITALDEEQAVYEAEAMLAWIEGKQFEYPIILDIEEDEHRSMSSAGFNAIIEAYCSTIEDAGYKTMIYSFASLLNKCDYDVLSRYDIWQAHWGVTYPSVFTSRYTMWQFTSDGKIPGLKGRVDMNICFYDYPTYIKENHLNGY